MPRNILRFVVALVAGWALAAPTAVAAPPSWIFQRSYYSHQPVKPVQVDRRLTGGPFYSGPRGGYFNGGWRWTGGAIVVGGRAFDQTHIYESWGQTGSQY